MSIIFTLIILFINSTSLSQEPTSCIQSKTEIRLLQDEKVNAQLSRDNCYEAICENTKTLSDFKDEITCKRGELKCQKIPEKSVQLDTKKIEESLINNFKQLQAMAPQFRKVLTSSKSQKFTPEDKITINLDWFLEKKVYFDEEDISILTEVEDDEELKDKYFEITETKAGPNEIKWILRVLKNNRLKEILSSHKQKFTTHSGDRFTTLMIIKDQFPKKNAEESTKSFIEMNLRNIQSLAKSNKTYFKNLLEKPMIRRLTYNQYSQEDLNKLVDEFKYVNIIKAIENDKEISRLLQDREISNGLTYKNRSNLIKVIDELPKANIEEVRKEIRKELKYCQESLNIAYVSAIPQDQHDKNVKTINNAKDKILSAFLKSYSKESSKSISRQLQSISFDLPLSRKELEKQTKLMQKSMSYNEFSHHSQNTQKVKYKIAKFIQSISDMPNIDKTDIQEAISGMPANKISDACDHISDHNFDNSSFKASINDRTHTDSNYIKVSPFTFNNLEQNMGIVYHEIGHNIDHYIRFHRNSNFSHESLNKHNYQISCLSKQSEKFNTDQISDQDRLKKVLKISFVGEDYADLVSAVFHKEKNLACSLTQSFRGLNLREGYQLLAPNYLDDNHSNAFYRLLNIEKVRSGSLPKQCSDFLKHHTSNLQVKDCLK